MTKEQIRARHEERERLWNKWQQAMDYCRNKDKRKRYGLTRQQAINNARKAKHEYENFK